MRSVRLVAVLAWVTCAVVRVACAAEGRLPNVVIILTDDQGYQDLGCFGSPKIRTPNIDRMAAEGMRFTDFYAAAPVCTPSRAALMTGCYAQRVSLPNVLNPLSEIGIHDDEITIAELLKARGYATACVGKWHLGCQYAFLPINHGFDVYFGLPYSNDMSPQPEHRKHLPPLDRPFPLLPLIRGDEVMEREPDQSQLTRRYTEEAVRFIEASKDRPFFLYLPHTMPHLPLYASERFKGKSPRGLYGDVVEEIDWSVGQVLETIKRLGLDEHTLVIYTSDNGPWLANGELGGCALPLRDGKATTFEGGMRVPCVMRWPGRVPAGKVCREMATTMDLLPTLAKLAGTSAPTDRIIDGKDIWALMAGEPGAKSPRESLFYYRGNELRAVRSGQWKLHVPHGSQRYPEPTVNQVPLSLYDLDADISETTNVADKHSEVVERLMKLIEQARDDLGDSLTKRQGKNVRPAGKLRGDEQQPPAALGHGMKAEQAQQGWISLFDGETAFGWENARVEGGVLIGGQTTASFGRCEVVIEAEQAGEITVGGKAHPFGEPASHLDLDAAGGPIALGKSARIRGILLRPLGTDSIFDGQDLAGWQRIDRDQVPPDKRPVWKVQDGLLHLTGGPGSLEYARERFGDFTLQLDIRTCRRKANSGVFFRNVPGVCVMGYEAQILNQCMDGDPAKLTNYTTGAIDDRLKARRLASRDHEWFTMTIIATGPHIATWVNGHQLIDWTDTRPPNENPRKGLRTEPGTIQIQAHDPKSEVLFRNIRVAKLR